MNSFHLLPAIVLSAIITIFGKYSGSKKALYLFKPLTTILIIFLAIIEGYSDESMYKFFIIAALFASLIGDYLIMLPKASRFLQGLIAFLAAHTIYIGAFFIVTKDMHFLILIPFAAYGLGIYYYLRKGLGDYNIPVILYMSVILLMGFMAVNRAFYLQDQNEVFVFTGAILFIISDSIFGWNKFKKKFKRADIFILSSYYAAQTLFALSIGLS